MIKNRAGGMGAASATNGGKMAVESPAMKRRHTCLSNSANSRKVPFPLYPQNPQSAKCHPHNYTIDMCVDKVRGSWLLPRKMQSRRRMTLLHLVFLLLLSLGRSSACTDRGIIRACDMCLWFFVFGPMVLFSSLFSGPCFSSPLTQHAQQSSQRSWWVLGLF